MERSGILSYGIESDFFASFKTLVDGRGYDL